MYIVIFALITFIFFYLRLKKKRKVAGIDHRVISQDLDGRSKRIYRDYRYGISAKPDIVDGNKVIEYKSSSIGGKAYRSDLTQMTAGMIAAKAKEGELRYGNGKRFKYAENSPIIQSTKKRIAWIKERMNWHLSQRRAPKAKIFSAKCRNCGYRNLC